MADALIAQVRRFNRMVTQTIGALQQDYLGRRRPMGESRLLFEIGESGATASELRSRLGLDSGYLSRLLRSLERQALVTTRPSAEDRRIRRADLTMAGLAELGALNRGSDELAQSILSPLNERQRQRLADAMAEVERLLSASAVEIAAEPATGAAARYCLSEYYRELEDRFDTGYDPALSLVPSLEEFAPPRGIFLIARLHGQPIGCGGLKPISSEAAYLKRMWIAPEARGLGLARRMLRALEDRARAMNYSLVRLETNKTLTEAQQLYRSSGYNEVAAFNDEPYAHHWFEKRLS
jgi:DNA-binding MarR family transcriptional regulator/N-acetylglutamate synthase-like GNAT family acetyltransferase